MPLALMALAKYWYVAVIVALFLMMLGFKAAYNHEKTLATTATTSLQSAEVANLTCSSSVDTLQTKLKEIADIGRQQQVLLANQAKQAAATEAALQAARNKLKNAVVPKDCQEGGEWAIEQLRPSVQH